jgi:peptidoglycan/LPS O-acetylase OafA/YrhL
MEKVKGSFYPQLDSLRAIAVLMVIVSHWFSQDHFLNKYFANGVLGVTLFFVLSGFLITEILLRSKQDVEDGRSLGQAFKVFYMRRSLRIFPIYYLLLFILLVFNLASVRDSFWWHFSYCSNFHFWIKGVWEGALSHLWSLAVEEQFYLVWPAIILLVPFRLLISALLTGVFIGVIFRLVIVTDESNMGRLLMPGSLDSFCIGGLFAYGRSSNKLWYKYYLGKQQLFLLLAFILLLIDKLPFFRTLSAAQTSAFYLLLISVAFGILINRVSYNIEIPIVKQILNNKILIFIGKISYGIYLFHNFFPQIYGLNLPYFLSEYSYYIEKLIRFIMLMALASASWYFFEKPILKIKERYVL